MNKSANVEPLAKFPLLLYSVAFIDYKCEVNKNVGDLRGYIGAIR
jgi:hypothetical protein